MFLFFERLVSVRRKFGSYPDPVAFEAQQSLYVLVGRQRCPRALSEKTAISGNLHDSELRALSYLARESCWNSSDLSLHIYSLGSSPLLHASLH